ncbi:MAG: hypothetical protein MZW92_08005 [Comamonadaceae bacterium]|nr:hypothetical protein [Comamonadaceae bacterium]
MGPIFAGGTDARLHVRWTTANPLEFSHLLAGFKVNTGNLVLVGVLYLVGIVLIVMLMGVVAADHHGRSGRPKSGLEGR